MRRRHNLSRWKLQCKADKLKSFTTPSRSLKSLLDLAIQSFALNCNKLAPGALTTLPDQFLEELWQRIKLVRRDSLFIWRAFAETHFRKGEHVMTDEVGILEHSLPYYFHEMTSNNFSWLVNLSIGDVWCGAADLADLHKLSNLVNLRISGRGRNSDRGSIVDDRMMRSWSESARGSGSFSRLETIFALYMPHLTKHSFQYLEAFPALEVFCLTKCGFSHKLRNQVFHGWRCSGDSDFMSHIHESRTRALYGRVRDTNGNDWDQMVRNYLNRRRGAKANEAEILPLLDVQLVPWKRAQAINVYHEVFCFIRDDNADWTSTGTGSTGEIVQAAKKRKLQNTRADPLYNFLASL